MGRRPSPTSGPETDRVLVHSAEFAEQKHKLIIFYGLWRFSLAVFLKSVFLLYIFVSFHLELKLPDISKAAISLSPPIQKYFICLQPHSVSLSPLEAKLLWWIRHSCQGRTSRYSLSTYLILNGDLVANENMPLWNGYTTQIQQHSQKLKGKIWCCANKDLKSSLYKGLPRLWNLKCVVILEIWLKNNNVFYWWVKLRET